MKIVNKIVLKNVSELVPYIKNAKKHSEHQIAKLVKSINEFGFNNPILLDGDNGLIAGHGRTVSRLR